MKNIDPEIAKKIKEQEEKQGINIKKLKPGTKIEVHTKNSIYYFNIREQNVSLTKKIIKEDIIDFENIICYFNGSTWGRSMIKSGWIGYGMNLEYVLEGFPGKKLSSPVKRAIVHNVNGTSYELWLNS